MAVVRYQVVNDPSYQVGDPGNAPGVCRPVASSLVPLAVQEAVISLHRIPAANGTEEAFFVIHPSAMPPGSVLYVSTALIHTSSPRPSGAFTTWVLKQDRLPACAP